MAGRPPAARTLAAVMSGGGQRWWAVPRVAGATLVALLCVGAATALGFWQYDAWQERRAAEQRDLTEADPRPIGDVFGSDDPFPGEDVGRPVELSGTWLPEGTVLVAGRDDASGRPGLWVVTPLTVGGPTDPAVPVVRGWVPASGTADEPDQAAVVPPPTGEATVVGWLQPPEGTGEGDPDPDDDVLPQLRVADLVQRVDVDLYNAYVVLDPAAGGLRNAGDTDLEPATLDQLPPAGRFTALRNLLYALEWWVFGAFAAFVWWRYLRDVRAEARPQGAEDSTVGSAE